MKRQKSIHHRNLGERGFVLLGSYFVMVVLAIVSAAFLTRSLFYQQSTTQNENRITAFHMAEAGLDQAISQLSLMSASNPFTISTYPCATGTTYTGGTAPSGRTSGCIASFRSMSATDGTVQGGYDIWVTDPSPSSRFRQIEVAGHTPVSGSSTVAGDCPSTASTVTGYACRGIRAFVELDDTLFDQAVFSEKIKQPSDNKAFLLLNGSSSYFDSYNSGSGPYGSPNVSNHGDIASNGSIANGTINLNGTPTINGQILENQNVYCKAPTANSGINSMGKLQKNNDYTLPDAANNIYRYSEISLGGNGILTINPTNGQAVKIFVDGAISVGGSAQIKSYVPVTIYASGSIDFGGNGVVNTLQNPSKFIVVNTGTTGTSVSGGTDFYGAVFSPDAPMTLGGGVNVYGAVYSKEYTHSGSGRFHYDEYLKNIDTPCTVVRLRSWQEKDTAFGGAT